MTLPGVFINEQDAVGQSVPRLGISTPFIVGELQRGPETPVLIRSMRDLTNYFGDRTADTASVHDWLDTYFKEDAKTAAYVSVLRGPSAAAASVTLNDGSSQPGVVVTALEKGSWANGAAGGLSADIDTSGGNFEVKIYLDGTLVESSGMVADGAAAAAWAAASSSYVSITDGAGGDPSATGSAQNLTGGDDDFDGITQTEIDAATARFTADLGPGDLVFPGRTSTTVQLAAGAAGAERNRMVKADLPATSNVATIQTHMATLRASVYADRIDPLLPSLECPGLTAGSVRTVPGSVLRCAAQSRNDAAGEQPNQVAAGRWGTARYCTAASIVWDDDDLEALNDVGANVIREVDGELKVYGMRTAADPDTDPAGVSVGAGRLRMAIREIARFRAELYVFANIDSGGVVLGNLRGEIKQDVISRYEKSLWPLNVDGDLLTVGAELVDGADPGTYVLEVSVSFKPGPSAEVVEVTVSREVFTS